MDRNEHTLDALEARLRKLSKDHQRGIRRFSDRLVNFEKDGLLTTKHVSIVLEHLLRLGERGRNPANTGNIEDLFCHTLKDTGDPIRAFAQALADSVKVVPMDEKATLRPPMKAVWMDGTSGQCVGVRSLRSSTRCLGTTAG